MTNESNDNNDHGAPQPTQSRHAEGDLPPSKAAIRAAAEEAKAGDEPQTPGPPRRRDQLLRYIRPARRWSESCAVKPPSRHRRLPCLMTPPPHRSIRRGETLDFCNGLKWSKYHSPPPCICYSLGPVIPRCLISWCADRGRRRFHGEGTLAGFYASLSSALCSFHSNYPESFHTFCHGNSREGPFS